MIVSGTGEQVEAEPLAALLSRLGYRSAYLVAGPRMLDTMLRQRRLSRLFLTLTHQILGGERSPPCHRAGCSVRPGTSS